MAMSREQQRSAAERILEKYPMTAEEKERQRFLDMRIEDYPEPDPKRLKEAAEWFRKMTVQ
jgi:hypothetical protein